eukprot:GFKZ01005886.1.p1 GENE.GFKZ01005886.1~~GFKZ01005886.1.p1  ORF type:complete len:2709 (+),score=386.99 GFKZ01005886.1:151-8277(+)
MSEDHSKSLQRQALIGTLQQRRAAVHHLLNLPCQPSSFLSRAITRLAITPNVLLAPITSLIAKASPEQHPALTKKIRGTASAVRKSPQPARELLSLSRAAALLCLHDPFRESAADLLLASVSGLHTSFAFSRLQKRSKHKAICAAYEAAAGCRIVEFPLVTKMLLLAAEGSLKNPSHSVAALGLLSSAAGKLDTAARERAVVALTTVCVKGGLGAAEDVIKYAGALLDAVEEEVVGEKVMPLVERALLRQPEVALPAAARLLAAVNVDVSKSAEKGLFPAVVQAVKSADEKTRRYGVWLATVLGGCVKGDALVGGIQRLGEFLKTARYAYQKVATVEAISGMACTRGETALGLGIEWILKWISTKKESNEEARRSGIRALVKLLARSLMDERSADTFDSGGFFKDVLNGKTPKRDLHSLLLALTEDLPDRMLPPDFVGKNEDGVKELQAVITGASKKRHEDCLRAFAVLVTWDEGLGGSSMGAQGSSLRATIGDSSLSPAIQESKAFPGLSEAQCALRCCEWMVRSNHPALEQAIATIYKISIDDRPDVSSAGLKQLLRMRESGDEPLHEKMFKVLWETQFSGIPGSSSVGKSYSFDDRNISAEKLGAALMGTVLPVVPTSIIPMVLLAANHPRLCVTPSTGRTMPQSRYWIAIERRLPVIDPNVFGPDSDDWLEHCLKAVFSEQGLKSDQGHHAAAAVNSFGALAHRRNAYTTRVLRQGANYLRPLAMGASTLSEEAHEALRVVRQADELDATILANGGKGTSQKRSGKKPSSNTGNARLTQQTQAAADKARAAAANANAMAEKANAARSLAKDAENAIRFSNQALRVAKVMALVAPQGVHLQTATMLSLILPSARLPVLAEPCREALTALTTTCGYLLRPLAVEISISLFDLERGLDVKENTARIILYLRDLVPPALDAEDFSLVSPIIRAGLLRDPDAEDVGVMSGRRGSTKRRDAIAVVKAAAQVMLEHCRPEAIDSAIAAAHSRAGSWIVKVLEREDGAFAAAAEALGLLAGTALTPGTTQMSQVLEGIISGKSSVRDAALAALSRIPMLLEPAMECPRDAVLGRSLWLARFDPDEANAELAEELWSSYKHPLFVQEDAPILLQLLAHSESDIRIMSARAIAASLCGKENEATRNVCIPQMFTMYIKKMPQLDSEDVTGLRKGLPPAVKRGKDRSKAGSDKEVSDEGWVAREGVGLAIENMATSNALKAKDITVCFAFLSGRGLGDSNDKVRAQMAKAATSVVQAAGTLGPAVLLPMIEKQLNTDVSPGATKEEIKHADRTRENLVMCLGAVAGFLPPDDRRVTKIADQVMKSALETPSEVVQNAAARCLVPLAKVSIPIDREKDVADNLFKKLWSDTAGYGERRGAAYALAGICEGLGMKYMKRSNVMEQIENAVSEKIPRRRQGAFILIETHAMLMGRKFEPYVVAIVPFLLSCMGDAVVEVRNACWDAAQAAMSDISSQGVKMILPSLLDGLQDRQWRTKAGSAEVLGAMAYCAPRQLAQCLPQVVPKLADALADAHPKVVNSAQSAINRIAAVVRSPEVRKLSPFLLAALRDPAGRTRGAIDAMLGSEFVHAIDAASLALLIPPLHRGLRDRSSELKKRSAAIVGSMCNNVANHFDVVPYLDLLLPALRVTLLDAIPDVRRTSARALGALAVSLGEKGLPDIVPWLINALLGGVETSVSGGTERVKIGSVVISSSAERSGAAMGLAEVAASMNDRRLEDVLHRVLAAGESSAEAREGGLMLIASMPRALEDRFEPKLGTALSATLRGLADDADSVREAALEAGRSLVTAYAKTSLEHLLPEILSAMREKLWRIRLAATRLLGDMLLVIAGARVDAPDIYGATNSAGNDEELKEDGSEEGEEGEAKDEGDEDEGEENFESPEEAAAAMTTEATMKAIEDVLGFQRRNEVLAALYIIRCDVSVRVRQTGMQVWKSVVANTPRVLREIMPSAVRQIVDGLGDVDEERRAAAGRTLGDLAQKLGDRVVPEVLPALQTGLNPNSSDRVRRGACEGLGELVLATPQQQLEDHASELIETAYTGLSDEQPSVRAVAAEVFSSLLKPLGSIAVDSVVPHLIRRLSADSSDAESALDALRQILRASGAKLMTIVVPSLLKERPLKTATARALATAATVGDASFEPLVVDVTNAIVESVEVLDDTDSLEPLEGILAAIGGCGGEAVKMMLDEIFAKFNDGYPERRVAASKTCGAFCRGVEVSVLSTVAESLLDVLIRQLADVDEGAAKAAHKAISDVSSCISSRALSAHVPQIRQSLRAASTGITVNDANTKIQGLQLPKAPGPFVPILTDGLLYGEPELREQAALGIGELVELTNAKSLAPFVIKLTGPLIRVMSDRFPWQVKAAVLKALLLLLKTAPTMLRTFAPQLQSTFVKSLSDKSRLVRKRACAALGGLVPIQARLEGLLNDLVNLGLNGDLSGTRAAAFHSCCQVLRFGKKLPLSAFLSLPTRLMDGLSDEDREVQKAAAKGIGLLAGRSEDCEQYRTIVELLLERMEEEGREYSERVGALNALGAVYVAGKDVNGLNFEHVEGSVEELYTLFDSAVPPIQSAACETSADLLVLLAEGMHGIGVEERKREVVGRLAGRAEFDSSVEVRVAALDSLKKIVLVDDVVVAVAGPALVVCAAETNTGIRSAADRVMRRAFLEGRELAVREGVVKLMMEGLDEEDCRFVERRIPKLRHLADSDDEWE